MLLHTPGLLLCYKNKTKHAKGEKTGGRGGEGGQSSQPHTVSFLLVSSLALGSTISYPKPPEQGHLRALGPLGMNAWMLYLI